MERMGRTREGNLVEARATRDQGDVPIRAIMETCRLLLSHLIRADLDAALDGQGPVRLLEASGGARVREEEHGLPRIVRERPEQHLLPAGQPCCRHLIVIHLPWL
jgi:hypothetical protein